MARKLTADRLGRYTVSCWVCGDQWRLEEGEYTPCFGDIRPRQGHEARPCYLGVRGGRLVRRTGQGKFREFLQAMGLPWPPKSPGT